MPTITRERYEASYQLAKAVRAGDLTEAEAVEELVADRGMDRGSAQGYIRQLNHFLSGVAYKRTINDPATRYFIEQIALDYGPEGLQQALTALAGHISYYETKASKRPSLRAVLASFDKGAGAPAAAALTSELDQAITASLNLADNERAKYLPAAGTKPAMTMITIKAFIRNPHVIAAALRRADGICERCGNAAPFKRKSDGTAYLEVHHLETLANGGDDTLENVLALCPNCHREHHYG